MIALFSRRSLRSLIFILLGLSFSVAVQADEDLTEEEREELQQALVELQDAVRDSDNYRLSIRDSISVSVFDEPDLSTTQRIDADGQIRFALLGPRRVAGLSIREAEEMLERLYVEERFLRSPQVTIIVESYAPKEVSVFGQVRSPGKLTFPIEHNYLEIVDVIAKAGGFTGVARSDRVRIARLDENGAEEIITINVERLISGGSSRFGRGGDADDVRIFPGDVIYVPERLF